MDPAQVPVSMTPEQMLQRCMEQIAQMEIIIQQDRATINGLSERLEAQQSTGQAAANTTPMP